VILLAAGNACVHVARARWGRREAVPENDPENGTADG
jgi:hypothetical protein